MNPDNPRLFFAYFILLWLFAGLVIAQVGGWAELARHYRSTNLFEGRKWKFRSCKMRLGMSYHNCLTVGINQLGLYLAVLFLFRIGHPPLLIPWQDLSIATGKTLLWKWTEFHFQQAPHVRVRFYGRLGEELLSSTQALQPNVPVPIGA